MLSLCCQSRRSNSSKSAWRKFGSFSVHPFLPHVGRTSGPHDKDGADVFSFSAALTEWFWLYTAHPERSVCAWEGSGITEGALMDESWVQEVLGHSIIFWAAVATWQKHEKSNCSFPVVYLGCSHASRCHMHTGTVTDTQRHSHRHTHAQMNLSGSRSNPMVFPTSHAPWLLNSWLRPIVPPLVSSLRLLTGLCGLESTLTQGNIEEWSITMADCNGQAQDLVAFICPPLLSFFPLFVLPCLHWWVYFPFPWIFNSKFITFPKFPQISHSRSAYAFKTCGNLASPSLSLKEFWWNFKSFVPAVSYQ